MIMNPNPIYEIRLSWRTVGVDGRSCCQIVVYTITYE